jgi:tetratricopeptide (TPR) repeat protein
VIAGLWLVLGVTPVLVAAQERKLEVALSPPAHAVRALVEKRLYGGFFSDLAVLRSALPESIEVVAILGDLHRGMGQWEPARERYEHVLLEAPEDVASLVNLGVYYFRRGDYASAIQYFNRAAGLDSRNAAAFFNLSQAYSESYLFTEQRLALSKARDIDEGRVSRWLARDRDERVVTLDMRSQRSQAIMAQLEEGWRAQEPEALTVRRYVSLGLPLGALALALVFAPILPIRHSPVDPSHGGATPRALRIAVPGLESIVAGEGGRAYLALLWVATCLVLALSRGLGYSIPWGISPGEVLPTVLGATGLVAFYGARIWWDFRTRI